MELPPWMVPPDVQPAASDTVYVPACRVADTPVKGARVAPEGGVNCEPSINELTAPRVSSHPTCTAPGLQVELIAVDPTTSTRPGAVSVNETPVPAANVCVHVPEGPPRKLRPGGPCRPTAPAGPVAPCGPAVPGVPAGPWEPEGPRAPVTDVRRSPLWHLALPRTSLTVPLFLTQSARVEAALELEASAALASIAIAIAIAIATAILVLIGAVSAPRSRNLNHESNS
jgi:hypothetical protein